MQAPESGNGCAWIGLRVIDFGCLRMDWSSSEGWIGSYWWKTSIHHLISLPFSILTLYKKLNFHKKENCNSGNSFYLQTILFKLFYSVLTLFYRQDLANLLRRRGYKLIKELLVALEEVKVTDSDAEETLTDNQDKTSTEEDESTGGFSFSFFTSFTISSINQNSSY